MARSFVEKNIMNLCCSHRFIRAGLRPGLVEKFAAAKSPQQKPDSYNLGRPVLGNQNLKLYRISNLEHSRFELLKLFILDPSLDSVEIEAFYIQPRSQIAVCPNTEQDMLVGDLQAGKRKDNRDLCGKALVWPGDSILLTRRPQMVARGDSGAPVPQVDVWKAVASSARFLFSFVYRLSSA